MSRIGLKPIEIPSGITVAVEGSKVTVKGPKGELAMHLPAGIKAVVADSKVVISKTLENEKTSGYHGLARTLIANMIVGVSSGYSKSLEIQGVGFKAAVQGQKLSLSLGYSGPIEYEIPAGIKITVDAGVNMTVTGIDKQLVGDVTAMIHSFFPAEPYKGKGIRYKGEHVRRKVGKTVA